MKSFFILLFLSATMVSQAKVWRVNNNPSLDGDVYQASTLFDGTDNATNPEANAGDTVYLEPSTSAYTGFDINKANIMLIGYGYLLADNAGKQAMVNNAKLNSVGFETGSAGSVVSGIEINGSCNFYTSNVTITRCKLANIIYGHYPTVPTAYTGIRVDKCFITSQVTTSLSASVTSITTAIENCIFSNETSLGNLPGITLTNKVRGLLRNNTFNFVSNNHYYNFYVANNIYINSTNFGSVLQSGNNVYRNNLLSYPQSSYVAIDNNSPNSNNVFAVNMNNVFNGPALLSGAGQYVIDFGTFTTESRFELKTGGANPAIGAGEGGTTVGGAPVIAPPCGAFGATDPYRNGGFPNIPRITTFNIPATVANGSANIIVTSVGSSNNN